MDELQRHYIERKKPDTKRIHTACFHLYQTLKNTTLMHSDRKQISGCLGLSVERIGGEGALCECFGRIEKFCTLIVMIVTQVHICEIATFHCM